MLLIRILKEMWIRFRIDLGLDRAQWQALVNTAMNLRDLNVSGDFLFRYLKLVKWVLVDWLVMQFAVRYLQTENYY